MVRINFDFLCRKKKFNSQNVEETNLSRVLGLIDVTAIGISSTLGSGIYVLAGTVITSYSGPSIVLSFIIAAVATFFSGICYAELGARVPRSGSAYVYIYVTIGEIVGFMMGWDLILEYVIGTASSANALSQYIDYLTGNRIKHFLLSTVPFNTNGLGPYPDFIAFLLAALVTVMMIVGVKESALLNKIFTIFNIALLSFIIVCGATKADFANWTLNTKNASWNDFSGNHTRHSCATSDRCGSGGYVPFGFVGLIGGAAKCFYAFIGFDAIASTGEEVINPKKNIPLSILITLAVVTVLYCGLSAVLTLMIPYYMLNAETPLPNAFEYVHLDWAKVVVSIGAIGSLSTCLYAGMFPMPRIVYSLASDGLIFKFLSSLLPRIKTPFVASITTGLLSGILAALFNLNELVDMMSIGTLMAYTLVSICVLILRYAQPTSSPADEHTQLQHPQHLYAVKAQAAANPVSSSAVVATSHTKISWTSKLFGTCDDSLLVRLFMPTSTVPTKASSRLVNFLTIVTVLHLFGICVLLSRTNLTTWYIILVLIILCADVVLFILIISQQPQVSNITTFKIPLVPIIPFLSAFINIYMMLTLSVTTWIRFLVWFCLGLVVYFAYGVRNSRENVPNANQNSCFPFIEHRRRTDRIKEKEALPEMTPF